MKAVLGRDGQNLPRFVQDASFVSRSAPKKFDPSEADDGASFAGTFMPDEVTRDTAKRMHYAAYRLKHRAAVRRPLHGGALISISAIGLLWAIRSWRIVPCVGVWRCPTMLTI